MMTKIYNNLSYSQIETFEQCPQKWSFRYIDKILFEQQNIHLDYGSAVHKGLENAFRDLKDNHSLSEENLLQTVNTLSFDYAYGDTKGELYKYAIEDMKRLIHYQGFYEKIKDKEIVGIEEEFNLKIPTMFSGENIEINIKGYIDLIYRDDDGKLVVVDHKTSKKKFDKNKRRNNLQIPIYFLAIKNKYGEYPKAGIYNFTKLNDYQESLFASNITIEQQKLMDKRSPKEIWAKDPNNTVKDIIHTFKDMNNAKLRTTTKPSPLCYWCDYNIICSNASSWKPKEKNENRYKTTEKYNLGTD
ncbi:PD-(D/E)XK nuclease family protein [Peptoniphilus sp. AGMB00490]|uniref:PD-(D/E)XK nuclease family protein n=1 Tax=Peptoniphilus faecalis TaxID=2731255 RepID=A0A848RK72_9FIRM|nr:PD-(D/E)XK nuclease family protein [Peptoniphilus faecalis]NMW84732.1 PD-(D/E)XK nuclease family protein [Peptoniphilus faecalis]